MPGPLQIPAFRKVQSEGFGNPSHGGPKAYRAGELEGFVYGFGHLCGAAGQQQMTRQRRQRGCAAARDGLFMQAVEDVDRFVAAAHAEQQFGHVRRADRTRIPLVEEVRQSKGLIVGLIGCVQRAIELMHVADLDRRVSLLYGMVHAADPSTTMRSLFIIDPKKIVRATLVYPLSTGRNFVEILRVIDSLQLCDAEGVVTPANWTVDQQVLRKPGRKRNGAY